MPGGGGGIPGFGGGGALQYNTNRPGGDYHNFDLAGANPNLCRSACQGDSNCVAWTYVNPGIQGPAARCWLKNSVPPAVNDACCVSGVK